MKNFCLMVQYDGSRYKGWAKQKNLDNTIQGKLETVLSKLFEKNVEVLGSGRTDAGVHAKGQICNFHVDTNLTAEDVMEYANRYLPEDIAVISAKEASERFHARYNVGSKKYVYTIDNGKKPDVFLRKYAWSIPDKLNLKAMRNAASYLVGTLDFTSFTDNSKTNKSMVKTIEKIEIEKKGNIITVAVKGDGFLYHMVRIIVGTLVDIGLGTRTPESINATIEEKRRSEAGQLAPAKGLCLEKVYY